MWSGETPANRVEGAAQAPECGCPSARIEVFPSALVTGRPPAGTPGDEPVSGLGHWPVQIRLIPPNALFLRGETCSSQRTAPPSPTRASTKTSCPGRVVMLGCPEFDDTEEYVAKFAEIFRVAGIKSITVVEMEVPCCSRLPRIVKSGLARAGIEVPIEEIVISRKGRIVEREPRQPPHSRDSCIWSPLCDTNGVWASSDFYSAIPAPLFS